MNRLKIVAYSLQNNCAKQLCNCANKYHENNVDIRLKLKSTYIYKIEKKIYTCVLYKNKYSIAEIPTH